MESSIQRARDRGTRADGERAGAGDAGDGLVVDGEIQEEQTGMTFTRRVLHGQIKSGDGAGENIKVYIMAGFLTVNCIILIDGREVLSA